MATLWLPRRQRARRCRRGCSGAAVDRDAAGYHAARPVRDLGQRAERRVRRRRERRGASQRRRRRQLADPLHRRRRVAAVLRCLGHGAVERLRRRRQLVGRCHLPLRRDELDARIEPGQRGLRGVGERPDRYLRRRPRWIRPALGRRNELHVAGGRHDDRPPRGVGERRERCLSRGQPGRRREHHPQLPRTARRGGDGTASLGRWSER